MKRVDFSWAIYWLKTSFSIVEHTNLGNLPLFLSNKLFLAIITPILTYSGEIWGTYAKSDLSLGTVPGSITETQIQSSEQYLEVSNNVFNIACGDELRKSEAITPHVLKVRTTTEIWKRQSQTKN